MLTEMFHYGKASALGLVSGILAGLVAITPAAGSVTPAWALVFGFGAAVISYQFVQLKVKMGYDDTLDVFSIHGIGGIFGALLVGLAATDVGGWAQLMVQAKSVLIAITLSGSITALLVWLIGRTIGFRTSEEDEQVGLDHSQHGEVGYGLTHL
jgi:Amt family ammonium transporter